MPAILNYMKLSDIAGWIGVSLVLFAYLLITLGTITPHNLWYGLMNLGGALGIILSSYAKRDYQPVILNCIWLVIAIVAIVRSINF